MESVRPFSATKPTAFCLCLNGDSANACDDSSSAGGGNIVWLPLFIGLTLQEVPPPLLPLFFLLLRLPLNLLLLLLLFLLVLLERYNEHIDHITRLLQKTAI